MSEIFHKSCYTSRSSGYKYRTLSTNTGERKRRNSKEDSVFETKFNQLRRAIVTRINKEMDAAQRARSNIQVKSDKVEAKVDTMVDFQNTVTALRRDLRNAEYKLVGLVERIEKLDLATNQSGGGSMSYSMRSKSSPMKPFYPIFEENEDISSELNTVSLDG